jgi:hypothetical protein
MRLLATLVAVILALAAAPRAQDAPLRLTLARAADYVGRFADQTAGMMIEERYAQEAKQLARFGYRQNRNSTGPHSRSLKSDLLLVRPEGLDAWMQFRDVYEVDGRKVRDRGDRLEKLFINTDKKKQRSAQEQAERIVRESARYNIGDIERTINLPILGLTILDKEAQPSFRFFRPEGEIDRGEWEVPKRPEFAATEGTMIIGFTEISTQTMIRTPQGRNLVATGRIWLLPESGEVRMTELRVSDYSLNAVVHVAYGNQDGFALPVPLAMSERYENRLNKLQVVEGTALYSNFRKLEVQVDEQIATPKDEDK